MLTLRPGSVDGRDEVQNKNGYAWTGYTGLKVQDLRRSAVHNLVQAGVAERVAGITGPKPREVFDRYPMLSTEDVAQARRKVEFASFADPAELAQT